MEKEQALQISKKYKTYNFSSGNEFSKFSINNIEILKSIYDLLINSKLLFSSNSDRGLKRWIEEIQTRANNRPVIFILMYNGKELIGSVEGYKQVSKKDSFFLSSVVIKKEYRSKLLGTSLLARAYTELSKLGYKTIEMEPKEKTRLINEWLSGRIETKVKDKDGNTKSIKRQFKNGKYYNVDKENNIQIRLPRSFVK